MTKSNIKELVQFYLDDNRETEAVITVYDAILDGVASEEDLIGLIPWSIQYDLGLLNY